jgi:hypothetical protein
MKANIYPRQVLENTQQFVSNQMSSTKNIHIVTHLVSDTSCRVLMTRPRVLSMYYLLDTGLHTLHTLHALQLFSAFKVLHGTTVATVHRATPSKTGYLTFAISSLWFH